MRKYIAFILLIPGLLSFLSCNREEITVYEGWELVWSDEFDGKDLDPSIWNFELGDGTLYGNQPGWGNNEQQIYTDSRDNIDLIRDGEGNRVLMIRAIQTISGEDTSYTSAKITTKELKDIRFGRIEARIRLPYSQGIWPAFWMLGTNYATTGWPGCGEIDIMEMLGGHEEEVHANVHYVADYKHKENLGTSTLVSGKYSDDYHIYTLDWTPEKLTWSIDSVPFHEQEITVDMKEYLRNFYLILNVAVGGYWPGYPDETSVFPQEMLVDYVRVYRDLSLDPPAEPELILEEETMGSPSIDATVAVQEGFAAFQDISVIQYGGDVVQLGTSTDATNGDKSLYALYPAGSWSGIYFQLGSAVDMSAYADGNLVVDLKIPETVTNFEVKLESTGGFASLNLLDYPSTVINSDFSEYTIPLADFVSLGLHLDKLTIPFALWNPMDADGNYPGGVVLVDNIRFAM
ncbi:MAG: family 16 glycosylhydrolase [Bacteroidota bacterium]